MDIYIYIYILLKPMKLKLFLKRLIFEKLKPLQLN